MTFFQEVASTFIGATSAFIFSIFLFYITEKVKIGKVNKDLAYNLQRELDYNLNFIQQYKNDYEKMLRQISSDSRPTIIFRAHKLQRLFLMEAFNKGLLYKKLSPDEINDLDEMLNFFSASTNQFCWDKFNQLAQNLALKADVSAYYEFQKDQIEQFLKLTNILKTKLKQLD